MERGQVKHTVLRLAVVLASMLGAIVIAPPSQVAAALEIESFLATPGVVRTNLRMEVIDFDPTSGLLYAAGSGSIGNETVVVAIDPDSLEIVAQAQVTEQYFPVADIDVSRNGESVVVANEIGVFRFDREDLTFRTRIDLPVNDARRVLAAPDRGDRFLTWGEFDGPLELVTGTTRVNLSEPFVASRPVVFGADSDSLFATTPTGVAEISLVGPPAIERTVDVFGDRIGTFSYVDGRVIVNGVVLDEETLTEQTRFVVDPEEMVLELPIYTDEVSGELVTQDLGRWKTYDISDPLTPTSRWRFPFIQEPKVVAPMSPGRLAVLEGGPGNGFFLSLVDTELLGSSYGEFHALTPVRVFDTRFGVGSNARSTPLGAGETVSVPVAGQGGVPETGVLAVAMNVTVTRPTDEGFVSVWPTGAPQPDVSNVNFVANQTVANFVTVAVGAGGAVDLNNAFGSTDVIFDVVGYYVNIDGPSGARYEAFNSRRALDTRASGALSSRRLGAGETMELDLDLQSTSDRKVAAAAMNITAVRPSEKSFLTVFPADVERPTASSVNFVAGDVRANMVVTAVSDDGKIKIFNASGSVDVLVDVFGMYVIPDVPDEGQAGRFFPIVPYRSFDSRLNSPFPEPGALFPQSALTFRNFTGWTDILNVTAVRSTADGYLSVVGWNDFQEYFVPNTSNVNFRAGEIVANVVYATGEPNNAIINPFGFTHAVIDRFGFLTPEVLRPVEQVWLN